MGYTTYHCIICGAPLETIANFSTKHEDDKPDILKRKKKVEKMMDRFGSNIGISVDDKKYMLSKDNDGYGEFKLKNKKIFQILSGLKDKLDLYYDGKKIIIVYNGHNNYFFIFFIIKMKHIIYEILN